MRLLLLLFLLVPTRGQEWMESLAQTPFPKSSFQAYRIEPIELFLNSFRPAGNLKGIILMPASSDQIYFFDWGRVELAANPTLLDALNAFTNKTQLTYSFVPPFLLIHHPRDVTADPLTLAADVPAKFQQRRKDGRVLYLDRPYDRTLPALKKVTGLKNIPDQSDAASWHFYRLSFVIHDPTAAEYLRAVAYGTKTSVQVDRKNALFKERPYRVER